MKLKKMTTILLSGIVGCCSCLTLIGCTPSQQQKVDSSKTQLYVGSYNGGCGEEWVEAIGARFEETYADYSFEPGKKGVQVWYEHDKVNYLGSQALNSLTVTSRDVMFIQGADYPDFFDDNNETNLLEITDIVTESLEDMGDTGTIEDKLTEDQKTYYKFNNKYYALPGYNGFVGVIYDVDLFDSKGLYFDENGKLGASLSDKRACGPDGIVGTYDDGLPATYEDFHTLCDYMKKRSITPIIWTGQYRFPYSTYMMNALYVDYEGKDRTYLQYNASNTINNVTDIITSISDDGVVTTDEIAITKDNFVQLAKQPGRYYALKVMEDIIKNKYYSSLSMDDAESHVMAQADFLESTMTSDKIAMIFEGSWWMSEADSVFEDMASINAKYSKENRRFGFMPMPKQSAERFGKCTLADATQSMMIIPAKVEESKKECAKMFVKFANTQQSLQEFTVLTGGVRAMECDYTDVMDKLTFWAKSLVDMKKNSDIVYSGCIDREAKNFVSTTGYTFAYSKVGTINENCPANAMVYRNVTAEQYFNGYYDYYN